MRSILLLFASSFPAGVLWAQGSSPIDTIALPFRAVTINDGLSQGMVQCIAQDPQGFLWFGTKDGLNRYDGYRFTVYRHDPTDTNSVRESNVTSLTVDRHGRLWVGTSTGVDLFDRATEHFQHLAIAHPDGDWGSVAHVRLDINGDLWAATQERLVKVTFATPVEEGHPLPRFTLRWLHQGFSTVTSTRDGALWGASGRFAFHIIPRHDGTDRIDTLATSEPGHPILDISGLTVVEDSLRGKVYGITYNAILEFSADRKSWTALYTLEERAPLLQSHGAVVGPEGQLWVPTFIGLFRFQPATRHMELVRSTDPSLEHMLGTVKYALYEQGGTLWIGTSGYGLLKYDPRMQRFNRKSDGSIRSLWPAKDGQLVVGRFGDFLRVFDTRTRRYTMEIDQVGKLGHGSDTLREGFGYMSIQDAEGYFWNSSQLGTVIRYRGHGSDPRIVQPEGEAQGAMFPLMPGRDGTLWSGGDRGLWKIDRRSLASSLYPWPVAVVNNPYYFVAALHQGPDGIVWAGTMSGLLRLDPATGAWQQWKHQPANAATLAVNVVFSVCADPVDPTGVLWLGTNGGGLNRFDTKTGAVRRYSTKDGLPNDVVYGVLADAAGDLWMSTNKGLSRFDPRAGNFRNFSVDDGLQSNEFNRYAYCKDAQGLLYFGGVAGFNWFDPRTLVEDSTPVAVLITDIKLMNKPVRFGAEGSPLKAPVHLSHGMTIPYSANMVTFTFAAMEFSIPEQHRYRYMLEGFDQGWIDAGTANSAIYTNLDPGTYTFRVRGQNRDGIWGLHGTRFTLTVRPPWWKTWWFYTLCGLVGIGGTLLYIRSLRRQKQLLERTVAVRTRELSRAKDRSDQLLNNILPLNVAAELKRTGQAEARQFEQVTVLFSDFQDFTKVSEHMSATDLVEELNVCFNAFDRIMEKYGIEKIKTIGDAYMAAGGVPDPGTGSPLSVVYAGLEMQHIMAERRVERAAQGLAGFRMRVGIHTGPVVAGIVGRRKFQYDIWGDTVNTASRLESTSEAGEVNISGATHALIRHEPALLITPRGIVQAKGKGGMDMFYVRLRTDAEMDGGAHHPPGGAAPELAGRGTEPKAAPAPRGNGQATAQPASGSTVRRILLAEDNAFNVMVAQDELDFLFPGVQVDVAENGALAVERVRQQEYDVVLMDVQMPVMDGYRATRAIRALPGTRARVPIVALTANVMKAEVERCKDAGMDGFIPKPFKREELSEAIAAVLKSRSAK
ncbi:MAG: response regulator [Flavobacteriales bacterium]|nr:response regulator [Flavobacteriales bacterium]